MKLLVIQPCKCIASFPGPRPASHHLQYGKLREGLGTRLVNAHLYHDFFLQVTRFRTQKVIQCDTTLLN